MDILKIFTMQEPVSILLPSNRAAMRQNVDIVEETDMTCKRTIDQVQSNIEIFRMQEPVSKELLSKKDEIRHDNEVVQEKNEDIERNLAKIKELQEEVNILKRTNKALETRIKASLDKNSFEEIMVSYDNFFKKIWEEREQQVNKNTVMDVYLENLECSYNELLEKFQKAKEIIYNLNENQDILKEELEQYKEIVTLWETRYEDLKEHSETSIAEANFEIGAKEKENLQEVAKLKSKILQRQAKINELEKIMKNDLKLKSSIYAPLRNKIAAK